MKKFKKFIAATLAAALTVSVGTTAFALAQPEIKTNTGLYKIVGSYGFFECKKGYSKTTNTTVSSRLVYASVRINNNINGNYVDSFYNDGIVGYNGSVDVSATNYMTGAYNYTCTGGIYGSGSFHSPIVESFEKTLGPND